MLFTLEDRLNNAYLKFFCNTEFKTIELFRLTFQPVDSELINKHISYRINSSVLKKALTSQRLKHLGEILEAKNPALTEVVQREVFGGGNLERTVLLESDQVQKTVIS